MNVNQNYYEMQLEGHPLAPAEVEVSDRQLDRFRELVRRGKGRRDFDDDCFYEVCLRALGPTTVPRCHVRRRAARVQSHLNPCTSVGDGAAPHDTPLPADRARFQVASSTDKECIPSTTAAPSQVRWCLPCAPRTRSTMLIPARLLLSR